MKFYKNFSLLGDQLAVVEHNDGMDKFIRIDVKPHLYVSSQDGDYKDIHSNALKQLKFNTITEAREYAKLNPNVLGFDRFGYSLINEKYTNDFDISKIKIVYIDIENAVKDSFPNIEEADVPINCLTIGFRGTYFCFTTLDISQETFNPNYRVTQLVNESELLFKFLQTWKMIRPDIVSGWNSNGYDLPYLAKRISNVLGIEAMRSLSPFNRVYIKKSFENDRENFSCIIAGISCLDFMELYKKFRLITRETYKLGFVAKVELGETKLELTGSFYETWTNYPSKFVLYNIIDTELVAKMEDKLGFIVLAIYVAYTSKTNYEDCLSVVLVWDVLIANYLFDRNTIVPYRKLSNGNETSYEGAFVKDPIRGFYEWAVGFDFESLYPRIIQTFNVSPETMISKSEWTQIRPIDIVESTDSYKAAKGVADKLDATLCGNGLMFSRKETGFVPVLAEMMFTKRKDAKTTMLSLKKQKEALLKELDSRKIK